jgi:hypothetical protein
MQRYSQMSGRFLVRALCVLTSGIMTVVVVGCGDDGLGNRYPVSGYVTYNGNPLEVGTVTFYAVGGQNAETRGASGSITNGKYTLSTIGGDDGVFPGEYVVAIAARAPDMSKAKANIEKSGGSMHQDDVAKAFKEAKSPIPKKYESTTTSQLKATVTNGSNKIDFPLTD